MTTSVGQTVGADAGAARPSGSIRTRLLDAGLELFGTAGYEVTTIQALCREARVSTRDFYRHIGDRIILFRLVFEQEVTRIFTAVAAALEAAPPVMAVRARLWMELWLGEMIDDPRRYRVLYTEAHGVDDKLEEHRRALLRSILQFSMSQCQICAAARGVHHPATHWEIPAITISGGAREALQQYMEGTLANPDVDTIIDSYVRLAVLVDEGW